jgi:crotonobetainyl-CoA:carnitine CoA-transferase CaiB-like acyl-CoA transferase
VDVAITDYLSGLYAMSGILLALRDRDRSGLGQHVDIGLLDAMTSALALPTLMYFNTGNAPGREGNQHHSLTPYEALEVADGLVILAVGNPRLWSRFCDAIDATELEHDPRFATNTERMRHRDELTAELHHRLGTLTRATVIEKLRARQLPCGQVKSVREAREGPQLLARQYGGRYPPV